MPRNVKVPSVARRARFVPSTGTAKPLPARRKRAPVARARNVAPVQGPIPSDSYVPPDLEPQLESRLETQANRLKKKLSPKVVAGGLTALAGLGVAKGISSSIKNTRLQEVQLDSEHDRRESILADLVNQSKEQALRTAIQDNLMRVQQQSPFLYNQVAAGRVLPQGAVVLGGRTRQDLLQELGRSMSEGQFSQ